MSTFKRANEWFPLPSCQRCQGAASALSTERFFLGFSLKEMNWEKKKGKDRGRSLKNKTTTTIKTFT